MICTIYRKVGTQNRISIPANLHQILFRYGDFEKLAYLVIRINGKKKFYHYPIIYGRISVPFPIGSYVSITYDSKEGQFFTIEKAEWMKPSKWKKN